MTRIRKPPPRITCNCCHRPDRPHRGHGWCPACYTMWVRAGRPDTDLLVPGTLQLIDEVAVELAVKGARPWLSPRERRIVVTELRARGWSGRAIAEHLGCAQRTVERHIAAIKGS